MTRGMKRSLDRVNAQIDRLSEHGVPQLAATSLGLLALYWAWSFAFFVDRFYESAAYSGTITLANPLVWAAAYGLTGGFLVYSSTCDRDYTRGALLVLLALHTVVGVTVIWPVAYGSTVPIIVGQYISAALFSLVTYLVWRSRVSKR